MSKFGQGQPAHLTGIAGRCARVASGRDAAAPLRRVTSARPSSVGGTSRSNARRNLLEQVSHLAAIAYSKLRKPERLPCGLARLETRPPPTGSMTWERWPWVHRQDGG
jgi:hypothetical protein